jgi:hypothetical protein
MTSLQVGSFMPNVSKNALNFFLCFSVGLPSSTSSAISLKVFFCLRASPLAMPPAAAISLRSFAGLSFRDFRFLSLFFYLRRSWHLRQTKKAGNVNTIHAAGFYEISIKFV